MAPNVVLRPLERVDVPHILEAVRESRAELAPWMPWCTPDYDEAGVIAYVENGIEKRSAGLEFEFAIFSPQGEYLGNCALNALNHENRFANLGYWIRTSRTRRGFATAAVHTLARWAFENTELGSEREARARAGVTGETLASLGIELERLEIVVAAENHASLGVAARAGAVREGTLRKRLVLRGRAHDAVVFSLLRGDAIRERDDRRRTEAGSGK
jgi:ribosomal-protein-serine acetyltransferase